MKQKREHYMEVHLLWWRWQDWTGECYDSLMRRWDGWIARGPFLTFWKAAK
jgi:hypothetical protein